MKSDIATQDSNIIVTESYLKARKSYGIFSALLIAWELIGISLPEFPLESVNVEILNPDAAPYVLFVLVIYFSIRLSIERHHQSRSVRKKKVTKIDFYLSHFIGLTAIIIYLYQFITNNQVFEIIPSNFLIMIPLSALSGGINGYLTASFLLANKFVKVIDNARKKEGEAYSEFVESIEDSELMINHYETSLRKKKFSKIILLIFNLVMPVVIFFLLSFTDAITVLLINIIIIAFVYMFVDDRIP